MYSRKEIRMYDIYRNHNYTKNNQCLKQYMFKIFLHIKRNKSFNNKQPAYQCNSFHKKGNLKNRIRIIP